MLPWLRIESLITTHLGINKEQDLKFHIKLRKLKFTCLFLFKLQLGSRNPSNHKVTCINKANRDMEFRHRSSQLLSQLTLDNPLLIHKMPTIIKHKLVLIYQAKWNLGINNLFLVVMIQLLKLTLVTMKLLELLQLQVLNNPMYSNSLNLGDNKHNQRCNHRIRIMHQNHTFQEVHFLLRTSEDLYQVDFKILNKDQRFSIQWKLQSTKKKRNN